MNAEVKELNNASMANKLFWASRTFGNRLEWIEYSDNKVTMTYTMKTFEYDENKIYRYPAIDVRKNTEDDYEDNFMAVGFTLLGKIRVMFTVLYRRNAHVWNCTALDIWPAEGDSFEDDRMNEVADGAYDMFGGSCDMKYGGLTHTFNAINDVVNTLESKFIEVMG